MPRKFFLGRDNKVDLVKSDRTVLTTIDGDLTDTSVDRLLHGLQRSVGVDPGSVAVTGVLDYVVDFTGAAVGDGVALGPPSTLEPDVVFCGFVNAADKVTLRFMNDGLSAVNPASGNWKITLLK